MKPSYTRLHPDLNAFVTPDGIFDVEPCDMHLMIGCRGKIQHWTKQDGQIKKEEFTIVAVQKNYKGDLAYRVVADSECFGYVVEPGRIIIWSELKR